jgi:transcriptional regulator with XRE-family HTH domain
MPRNPEKNFLRAWREYRRLTQSQLAEKIDTTGAVISLLESGDRRLSDKWLRRLAPALGIQLGWLLERSPEDIDNDVFDVWSEIPEGSRKQALDVLKAFRGVENLNEIRRREADAIAARLTSQAKPRRRDTKED